jgi:adenylate cyclase
MPEQSRQLAAIMFTDIVAYTALMGQDEQKAFAILQTNRNIQRPIIEQYDGKWKTIAGYESAWAGRKL